MLGVAVVAVPVLRGEDGPTLGPGSAELADDLGIDLLSVLENAGATGATGEVTELPVARSADPDAAPVNPDLATVLLVGVGDATLTDVRRAGCHPRPAHPEHGRPSPPRSPRSGTTMR